VPNNYTITNNISNETATGAVQILTETRGRLLQFFDISVYKQINANTPQRLTELPVNAQIAIDLSEELSGRTAYTVYRYHDNEVQIIGMDVSDGEFYTISRGTGNNDTDQVVIHTRRFSTYAIVENILTIDGLGSDDVDVQARIIDLTAPIYRIDIEWGEMKFTFVIDENEWKGMDGDNNRIDVTNHSNADVNVGFSVVGEFDMEVEHDYNEIGKVPSVGADALSIEAFLLITSDPDSQQQEDFKGDYWHKVGIITVTIKPDGVGLMPKQ
jgi:hypothetical protein